MVIIDFYGKIEKTLISDKLKLYIDNIPSTKDNNWKSGLVEIMQTEIQQREIDVNQYKSISEESLQVYDHNYIKNIIKNNFNDFKDIESGSLTNYLNHIADQMVYLFMDYKYEDMPFFNWKTNCFDSRFCEDDYSEKIVNLINFLNSINRKLITPRCIYSSNNGPFLKTRILPMISTSRRESKEEYIKNLKKWGEMIDNFIEDENSYYKFDYISNGIFKNNRYNSNHLLNSYSLIEMLLLKTNEKTRDLDRKLVFFLNNSYGEDSKDVARLLRQMRNKIGHGDFLGFINKSYQFSNKFMKNFWFDYTEYSHQNWVLSHVCWLLDNLLSEILYISLKDKNKITRIINGDEFSESK